MKKPTKRLYSIIVFFIFISLAMIYGFQLKNRPINEILANQGLEISELLYSTTTSKNQLLFFFVNDHSAVSCALLKKSFISYRVLKVSGSTLLENATDEISSIFSSYDDHGTRKWIIWGVIYNNQIQNIYCDQDKAEIINVQPYNIRIYYLLGNYDTAKILPPFVYADIS